MVSNLLWCIIGIMGGAIVNYFFHFIEQKRKILNCTVKTKLVPNSILKGIDPKYKNKIYASRIVIKNNGNCTITGEDFIPSNPLCLKFYTRKKGIFLIYNKCKPHNIYLIFNTDKSIATIYFEYILPKEEISFTVFHTNYGIHVIGKIKDGKIIHVDHL